MSSYQDQANAVSNILTGKGDALANAAANKGQIWGSTVANLGQVVPQQVQAVMKQAAERRKKAQIQQIFQQYGSDFEKALPEVMALDQELGLKLSKDHLESKKLGLEMQKLDWEYKKAKAEQVDRMLGGVHDDDSWARYLLARHSIGEDVKGEPLTYDPEYVKQARMRTLSIAEQLKYESEKADAESKAKQQAFDNSIKLRSADLSEKTHADTVAENAADNLRDEKQLTATIANQQGQLAVSRGNLSESIRSHKANEALDKEKAKNTESSQAQITASGYAQRMDEAEDVLDKVEDSIRNMGLTSFAVQSRMPAAAQSETFQRYDQAGRNFINAVLRRESGAAVSASEFDNARRQYLPQPGDGPDVKAQKQRNRQTARETLIRASGSAYTPPPPPGQMQKAIPGIPGGVAESRDGGKTWVRVK